MAVMLDVVPSVVAWNLFQLWLLPAALSAIGGMSAASAIYSLMGRSTAQVVALSGERRRGDCSRCKLTSQAVGPGKSC